VVKRTGVDPKLIGDCQIGNVLQPGAGAMQARVAQFLGGMPIDVPVLSLNRQCSSGLQAVASVAGSIKAGTIDVGLGGGVESMSLYSMGGGDTSKLSPKMFEHDLAKSCLIPMGITSENVAAKWQIPREKQDALAASSHAKALSAQKEGLFDSEIVPVATKVKHKEGKEAEVVIAKDEGPRAGTTQEGLGKLKPAFKKDGTTTAGNSSQVSDGAALVLLARRSAAKELKLPILARLRSFAVVGVEPQLMGIGPAFAIPAALEKANLKVEDIDIYEINEAFASQATMSVEHLKIPLEKVNPKGGAIALGHPLGCTGSRQIATLIPELKRTGKKLGVVSMCIGTGMGAAGVIESE
jgi:acetyl-CoA acyltransferase 1